MPTVLAPGRASATLATAADAPVRSAVTLRASTMASGSPVVASETRITPVTVGRPARRVAGERRDPLDDREPVAHRRHGAEVAPRRALEVDLRRHPPLAAGVAHEAVAHALDRGLGADRGEHGGVIDHRDGHGRATILQAVDAEPRAVDEASGDAPEQRDDFGWRAIALLAGLAALSVLLAAIDPSDADVGDLLDAASVVRGRPVLGRAPLAHVRAPPRTPPVGAFERPRAMRVC